MTEQPTCAVCGSKVPPDEDHVHVVANAKRMRDRDGREDYYAHPSCWREETAEWRDPA
ncbi:hypothetical protein [Halobacterium litoreum]|uniref:Ribosome biogenesis protein Nop10 n=1 Tax=Halobacterium litoreum TaxID=2039234 RepID=A0ABD5N7W2_9EURY|nr:hypothetical protein [Halobacterium litoreum]UHH14879.1 hypothetical protein LT972_14830 [Halobacterium litoreum]